MTEEDLRNYLRENGYPEHIVKGGRAGLISRWNDFVKEVEQGYHYGIEDYRNDLDIRGVIALTGLAEEAVVTAADTRFRAMLKETEIRVWESFGDDPWWDFGYPRNARGELLRDLKTEGLLEQAD